MSPLASLVISFPRCRMAWLSELLHNPPQSFAVHEGMNHCGHKMGLFRDMASSCGSRWFVDCSSSWLVNPDSVTALNPARVVMIQPDDISGRFDAHWAAIQAEIGPVGGFGALKFSSMRAAAIDGWERIRSENIKRLWQFGEADLDSLSGCRAVAEAAVPGLEVSQLRFEDLRLKRITQDIRLALGMFASKVDPDDPGV